MSLVGFIVNPRKTGVGIRNKVVEVWVLGEPHLGCKVSTFGFKNRTEYIKLSKVKKLLMSVKDREVLKRRN